ncbi:MAG TPA: amino acid permease [Acidobacteriota bacterium]|nr:amino acid permease [Acidobacteriota bacterium]
MSITKNHSKTLQRKLGLAAVLAIVIGDMLGSGIFFSPGALATVAHSNWQIYFFWGLAGIITLCATLTLAEMTTLLPKAGASYYIIREAFGPFWGFLKIWVEMFVSGPGSVAGISILFGEFLKRFIDVSPTMLGIAGILLFTIINLLGVRWGGRTQITITVIKLIALLSLVIGSILFAKPAAENVQAPGLEGSLNSLLRFIGLGIGAVLFTYDGWIDATHVAGEVTQPKRNLPRSLILGVGIIIVLYLVVNYAFLRIVPIPMMQKVPDRVAAMVATAAFGSKGADFLQALITISILGAMGGLIMTTPRLFYGAALEYRNNSKFFAALTKISGREVPYVAILFCAFTSILALTFFASFSRIVNFFVVAFHFINILMVASIFKLRKKTEGVSGYRTPFFPITPLIYIVVMSGFLISALIYNPVDTLIGVALLSTGIPFYFWMRGGSTTKTQSPQRNY